PPLTAVEGDIVSDALLATFIDPAGVEPGPISAHYSADIDWGDATGIQAGAIWLNGSMFEVRGSHTYIDEGNFPISVVIHHATAPAATAPLSAAVADSPPTISARSASASALENASATNSGSFDDYDDAVTITASTGTVTQSGSVHGNWTWSGTGDEDHPY